MTADRHSRSGLIRADETHMQAALEAAAAGHRGSNPLVGAVLALGDRVLAVGHHRGAGSLHAERQALETFAASQAAGEHAGTDLAEADLADAVLYSTLEPCRHHGRQPPCTEAILESGVGRVVYGDTDPTRRAGGGGRLLAEAGVGVDSGVLEDRCRDLNHRWRRAQHEDRPFVTVHLAQTLDGRIAAADGTSMWITSPASRRHTHMIRERIDAILVGTETVRVDDPRLTARGPDGRPSDRQPLRCVMGLRGVPAAARLRQDRPEGEGWRHLATRDPSEALRMLAETDHRGRPVRHLLVEGGARVMGSFFAADLVDEVFVYQAPLLLGAGPSSVGDLGVGTLDDAPRFRLDPAESGPVRLLDQDVCTHLAPTPESPSTPCDQTDRSD